MQFEPRAKILTQLIEPHRIAAWLPLVVLPLLLSSQGCGWSRRPVLVPVEGRLTMGGDPLAGKVICLIPKEDVERWGTADAPFLGTTRDDGSYSIESYLPGALTAQRGVAPGQYVVTVTEPAAGGDAGQRSPQKTAIPKPYTQARTSMLRVDVSAKAVVADFDLKSRP